MRSIEVEQTVKIYSPLYNEVQQSIKSLIECGKCLCYAGSKLLILLPKN